MDVFFSAIVLVAFLSLPFILATLIYFVWQEKKQHTELLLIVGSLPRWLKSDKPVVYNPEPPQSGDVSVNIPSSFYGAMGKTIPDELPPSLR